MELKKKVYTLLLMGLFNGAYSQCPQPICPDFTAKDIDGVEYTLSKLINQGKYVAFDFVTLN